MFAEEKLRVSAGQSSISRFLSVAAMAPGLPLFYVVVQELIHRSEKFVLPEKFQKQSEQVPFLSREMVPVSGIWRPDHSCCPNSEEIWLRKQTLFPPCPGCGAPAHFALIEEIGHISEDPDFK